MIHCIIGGLFSYTLHILIVNGSNDEKTTTKTTTKTTMKQEAIIKIIAENSHISAKEMAEKLNLTVDGVRYHLTKMRKSELYIIQTGTM